MMPSHERNGDMDRDGKHPSIRRPHGTVGLRPGCAQPERAPKGDLVTTPGPFGFIDAEALARAGNRDPSWLGAVETTREGRVRAGRKPTSKATCLPSGE